MAGTRQFQNLKRLSAPIVDSRDQDIGVCGDPEQLAPTLGVFTADIGNEPIHVLFADPIGASRLLIALDELHPAQLLEIFPHGVGDHVGGLPVLGARGLFPPFEEDRP